MAYFTSSAREVILSFCISRALKVGAAGYATKDSDPALLLTAIRKVAAGGRYIDPDLADRMVFEVGLTDARPLHSLLSEREFSVFERLAQGANVNDIAQQLALSSKTISTHKAYCPSHSRPNMAGMCWKSLAVAPPTTPIKPASNKH
jgi:FixJ family two-component response regulator